MSSASAARPAGCVCRTPRCCVVLLVCRRNEEFCFPFHPKNLDKATRHAKARASTPARAEPTSAPGSSPRLRQDSGGIKLMLWDDDSNETGVATDRAFLGQFEARAVHTSLQGNRSHIGSRSRRSCAASPSHICEGLGGLACVGRMLRSRPSAAALSFLAALEERCVRVIAVCACQSMGRVCACMRVCLCVCVCARVCTRVHVCV